MTRHIKLLVLGGSALGTPKLFEMMGRDSAAAYDVVLVARDLERLDLVARISRDVLTGLPNQDIHITTSDNAAAALEGADYVLNQIRVGGLDGRAFDESFPRRFGIPGEETVGPGGFNNALRTIPVVLDYCRLIEQVAPNAILLNLTNPASILQSAIRRYTHVNVIGMCDSPVTLMETIARVLGASRAELEFDATGMLHFGWITAVRQAGRDRLPEILDRLEELPKLEVDPELVRAMGVIPSVYLKYYFHPDRVLAASEGRPTRAEQLKDLSIQILDDFRHWQPGDPPAMLARRGAVWYEEIISPTLLALAEKRTAELVLEVDNDETYPWLPAEAIVEVPVPILDGILQAPRRAAVPNGVIGLIRHNCAYEMLAAEAIVERDRAKALCALTINPLIGSFNQARAILNLIWPTAEKSQISIQYPAANQKPADYLQLPKVLYGDRLLETAEVQEGNFAVVTMEEPWVLAKDRLPRQPTALVFVRELDWYRLEEMERALPKLEAVVGLGGGTALDAAKYIGWRRHIPVDEIPSIVSVDAAVTKSIAARAGGHVTYIGFVVARDVYVDYTLIQGAPPRLNRSGVGDILSAHTALWDWRLAHQSIGERFDPGAAGSMRDWLARIKAEADHICRVDQTGIRVIMEAFEDINLICRRFGSSQPQEGSEHTFAYNAEFQTHRSFLHGELIGLGAFVMALLQDNDPEYLRGIYRETGLLWQPSQIGLAEEEFAQTLRSLNWYQKNFGRRYSVLDERKIDAEFIDMVMAQLEF
jgi:6-phospho-beta-glucosidase